MNVTAWLGTTHGKIKGALIWTWILLLGLAKPLKTGKSTHTQKILQRVSSAMRHEPIFFIFTALESSF